VTRIAAKCAHYAVRGKPIPCWARQGMEERFRRVEQVEHRVQMLLGICGAKGVLPLEFKPARSVADLLLQHLDELETEAAEKGGVQQVLAAHFAKIYKLDWQQRTAHQPAGRCHCPLSCTMQHGAGCLSCGRVMEELCSAPCLQVPLGREARCS
jgi:hypothetical protein